MNLQFMRSQLEDLSSGVTDEYENTPDTDESIEDAEIQTEGDQLELYCRSISGMLHDTICIDNAVTRYGSCGLYLASRLYSNLSINEYVGQEGIKEFFGKIWDFIKKLWHKVTGFVAKIWNKLFGSRESEPLPDDLFGIKACAQEIQEREKQLKQATAADTARTAEYLVKSWEAEQKRKEEESFQVPNPSEVIKLTANIRDVLSAVFDPKDLIETMRRAIGVVQRLDSSSGLDSVKDIFDKIHQKSKIHRDQHDINWSIAFSHIPKVDMRDTKYSPETYGKAARALANIDGQLNANKKSLAQLTSLVDQFKAEVNRHDKDVNTPEAGVDKTSMQMLSKVCVSLAQEVTTIYRNFDAVYNGTRSLWRSYRKAMQISKVKQARKAAAASQSSNSN